jgi:Peptidase family C25
MKSSSRFLASLWLGGTFLATAAATAAAPATPAISPVSPARFRIEVRDDGVYGITYEALAAAGLKGQPESARLALSNRGVPVPIWVEDGGDGRFGPGDRLELIGRHLAGTISYYDRYSPLNVYVLDILDASIQKPARLRDPGSQPGIQPAAAGPDAALLSRQHLEHDDLLLRFSGREEEGQDLWYWAKLTQIDAQPFRQTLDLSDLDAASGRPLEIRLRLRGWSHPAVKPGPDTADHRVEVTFDGSPVGEGEWNNSEGPHDLRLPPIPASQLTPGPHKLAVRVPKRAGSGGDPIVDVSVVDWIELVYPRQMQLRGERDRLELASDASRLRLIAPGRTRVVLYGDDGTRQVGRQEEPGVFAFGPLSGHGFEAVADGLLRQPNGIAPDTPSTLASNDHRADYLLVTPAGLRAAVGPLAELRRRQGLAVETVDVQAVYDEFNHGIPSPQALRDFFAHAYHHWRPPAPRFVLLVGDASWDTSEHPDEARYPDAVFNPGHGTAFAHVDSTPYPPDRRAHRNLIPTWSYDTRDGHAAGDNWFADVDGDDGKPDLAIGRFPVTTADEVAAIVDKIVRYETATPVGAERHSVLWISNEDASFQAMSDRLAAHFGESGYTAEKIYARAGETASEADQVAIRSAIDRGPLLVHFVGHGGRFIWRTGPPDWTKHRDLFGLEDVDRLAPGDRLPVVLAMTCYSAPFDHPTADSIGEKFLRTPGRGAVAVVAASWRNAPSYSMSEPLVDELLRAPTVGEALESAKRASSNRDFVEQYNLLGDPALRLQGRTGLDAAGERRPPSVPVPAGGR